MTIKRLIVWTVLLSLMLSACALPRPTATPTPEATPATPDPARFESTDCWFDEPPGQTVECGYLTVPEDRARNDGKTIQLAVARFKSTASSPAPDPIVYLEGGPGGSPLRSVIGQFNALFAPFLEERDLILVDQRGTGYSRPALDCPEYKDWVIGALNENLSTAESEKLSNAALLECRNRLADSGVNLAAYDSAANAADLNDLRLALGIDDWNLYGISYGTRLALTVMRDFPQGVRSVAIDSVVPLQSNLYTEIPANGARAFEVLFDSCASDAACNEAFPDLRGVFFDLVERLNAEPATFSVRLPSGDRADMLMNGDGLMGLIFQSLYATSIIPLLPRLVYEVRDGNYGLVAALQGAFLEELDNISYGMHYSVQCEEEVPFGTRDQLSAEIARHVQYTLFEGTGIFDLCGAWEAADPLPVENQAVASDIPTLVLSGEFDPITPPGWGQLAAETLPNSFFFELPSSGHGASLTGGECPRGMVMDFFDAPGSEPDAACLASELGTLAFAGPLETLDITLLPFTQDQMRIAGVRPEGWAEIAAGAYSPTGSITDRTAILQQAAPVSADMFLNLLKAQIEQAGSEVSFEELGTRTANGLTWTLYSAEVQISTLDLGLAQSGGNTYLVLMQSVVDEREALYARLFLPTVDALRPLGP